jgi:methionyl-tRNA formyltransferase
VLQPERLNDTGLLAALADFRPDLGVVTAYGKILTEAILAIPHLGLINVHGSLLPRYRGAAPVHRAVLDGERETGITIMRVVKRLDAGPMLATARRPIGPDDTSDELERDLAQIGAPLLVSVVDALASGPVPERPQDEALATYAPRLAREDGAVDWRRSAAVVHNLIRGLHPWPHAFTYHHDRRLILLRSRLEPSASAVSVLPPSPKQPIQSGAAPGPLMIPGTILDASGDRLLVATGDGILAIVELQAEGRRPMTTREFLAGSRLEAGDALTNG